ncbi:hypothetical protein P153DRAFT_142041 [Dothidotthia symphoricarpi CBS 119687]|uniref:Uncharacterized protein n=1 Tax=Dothidotthia symphoricarpi CBS 119687 TaxID=1392245 RepID=A0A6A6A058_9PLEO|nr:uncharacterized protein P153DRAFT_142041 [Dothidotthia symphoricarpi CBS 119687]KAF2123971.1 hypothetical protein P153DRAFT_142041 [Dothidotthia symphoricarpi CBS 119687]
MQPPPLPLVHQQVIDDMTEDLAVDAAHCRLLHLYAGHKCISQQDAPVSDNNTSVLAAILEVGAGRERFSVGSEANCTEADDDTIVIVDANTTVVVAQSLSIDNVGDLLAVLHNDREIGLRGRHRHGWLENDMADGYDLVTFHIQIIDRVCER